MKEWVKSYKLMMMMNGTNKNEEMKIVMPPPPKKEMRKRGKQNRTNIKKENYTSYLSCSGTL